MSYAEGSKVINQLFPQSNKLANVPLLDGKRARELYKFYHETEPFFEISNKQMMQLVFAGGFTVSINSNLIKFNKKSNKRSKLTLQYLKSVENVFRISQDNTTQENDGNKGLLEELSQLISDYKLSRGKISRNISGKMKPLKNKDKEKEKKKEKGTKNNDMDSSFLSGIKNSMKNNDKDSNQSSITLNINEKIKKEIKDILTESHDYYNLYGCCPLKIYTDMNEKRKRASIPAFGLGEFRKVLNNDSLNYEVKFILDAAIFSNKFDNARKMENISVFVWPDKKPTRDGIIQSSVAKIYKEYLFLEEMRHNILDGDYEITHPPIVTTTPKESPTVNGMVERQIYADSTLGLATTEQAAYIADQARNERMEAAIEEASSSETKSTKRKREAVWRVDMANNAVIKERYNSVESGNVYQLIRGENIVHQLLPKVRALKEFIEQQNQYQDILCLLMGFPKNFITRERSIKTDQTSEQEVVLQRVLEIRNNMILFFNFYCECMFNSEMKDTIELLKDKLYIDYEFEQKVVFAYAEKIVDFSEWKSVFEMFGISNFREIRAKVDYLTKSVYEEKIFQKVKQSEEVNMVITPEEDIDIKTVVNTVIRDHILEYIKVRYQNKFSQIDQLQYENYLELSFGNTPFLSFKTIQEIQVILAHHVLLEDEEITLLRNRLGVETNNVLMKQIKKRKKKLDEEDKKLGVNPNMPAPQQNNQQNQKDKKPEGGAKPQGNKPEKKSEDKSKKEGNDKGPKEKESKDKEPKEKEGKKEGKEEKKGKSKEGESRDKGEKKDEKKDEKSESKKGDKKEGKKEDNKDNKEKNDKKEKGEKKETKEKDKEDKKEEKKDKKKEESKPKSKKK